MEMLGNITEHFKSKQQRSFISFSIVTTLLILQNFSNPLLAPVTVSPLPIVLIINLSAKSNQKPIE